MQNFFFEKYYTTTSSENDDIENYERYEQGLRLALSGWLDVKGGKILDLGCGTGQLCWLLKKLNATEVVGINLCEEELEIAKRRVDASFEHEDILEYLKKVEDESVDHIYALNIFEHLEKE